MNTARRLAAILSFIACALSIAFAQDVRPSGGTQAPTVTASASDRGVRFAALGGVTQMRVEIYTAAGERVFDSDFRAGTMLDWSFGDVQPQLADGTYLCALTVRDFEGRLRQGLGAVSLQAGHVSLRQTDESQLAAAQAQALAASRQSQVIEPAGADDRMSLLIVPEGAAQSVAVVAHDGRDGRVVSSSGALTLRTGDFFTGKDTERVRLTEDGRVGIGVEKPEAALDVAGEIRARDGIRFADGTLLTTAGKLKGAGGRPAPGEPDGGKSGGGRTPPRSPPAPAH